MTTPANIVRAYLIEKGLVIMPGEPGKTEPYVQTPGDGSTLCFTSSLPDEIDQAVFIKGPAGLLFGRSMRTGKTWEHAGIAVMVRSLEDDGYDLANAVATALDQSGMMTLTVGEESHYVQSIYRTSPVIELGEEVGRRRQRWTMHARLVMQDREPSLA